MKQRALLFYTSVLILCGALVMSCSVFDDSSGLGDQIIDDANPGLVDINRNFSKVTLDASIVQERFSVPVQPDTGFGSRLAAGRFSDEVATGYTRIPISLRPEDKKIIAAKDTLRSVSLRFTIDTTYQNGPATNVAVYAIGQRSFTRVPLGTLQDSIRKNTQVTGSDTVITYVANLSSALRDSIFRACTTKVQKDTVTFKDSTIEKGSQFEGKTLERDTIIQVPSEKRAAYISDTLSFFNFRLTNDSALVRFAATELLVQVKSDTTIRTETFGAGYRDYSVFEDNREGLSDSLIASVASERMAVFKIDLTQLWQALGEPGPGSKAILSAAMITRGQPFINSLEKNDSLYFLQHIISETLNPSLVSRFELSLRPKNDFIVDSVLAVESYLQNLSDSRPESVFLLLRMNHPRGKWGKATWTDPRLEAVLVTTR